jgi:hypothetical protein
VSQNYDEPGEDEFVENYLQKSDQDLLNQTFNNFPNIYEKKINGRTYEDNMSD